MGLTDLVIKSAALPAIHIATSAAVERAALVVCADGFEIGVNRNLVCQDVRALGRIGRNRALVCGVQFGDFGLAHRGHLGFLPWPMARPVERGEALRSGLLSGEARNR